MILSGQSPDGRLVEIVELEDHPWFVASQFHPEFKSRPERPHPLFDGFVAASLAVRDGREPVFAARADRRRRTPAAAAGRERCRRVRPQRLTSRSRPPLATSSGRRVRRVDPRRRGARRAPPGSPTSSAWPYGLLIPANAHRGLAGRRVRPRRVGPDDPDRGPARRHRAALGGRRLLRPDRGLRPGLPGHRRVARGHDLGRASRSLAGPVMGGAGAVWRHGTGWPRAIGVALLRRRPVRRGRRLRGAAADPRRPARRRPGRAPVRAPRSSSGLVLPCAPAPPRRAAARLRRRRRSWPSSRRWRSARSRRVLRGLADRF